MGTNKVSDLDITMKMEYKAKEILTMIRTEYISKLKPGSLAE